ncbi:MAG: cytochrome c biogenesis protein CcsA [bacterium JZ-2024 1]
MKQIREKIFNQVVLILLPASTVVSLYFVYSSVPDKTMGEAVKIFYLHFPIAFFSLLALLLAGIFGALYLKKRDLLYDALSASSAEVGLLFLTLTLLTGMIWAKTAWGFWWTWDPRLTSVLILWLLYMGYFALRTGLDNPDHRARVCAVASLVFALDLPIIHFAPRIWKGIHPVVVKGITRIDLGHPSMFAALFSMMFTILLLGFIILFTRYHLAYLQLQLLRQNQEEKPG